MKTIMRRDTFVLAEPTAVGRVNTVAIVGAYLLFSNCRARIFTGHTAH